MREQMIQEALNGIRDEYITESCVKLGILGAGTLAAGAAADAAWNVILPSSGTAAKAGFGAWLAKGGWVALVAGVVVAAGVAAGAFLLGKGGDVPPVGSGEVTTAEQEQSRPEGDVTEEMTEEMTEDTTEKETEADTEAHVHSFGAWEFAVTPTCTEKGIRARACSSCSAVEQEEMPAGLHVFESRSCTRCGEKQTTMTFTSYGDGTCCLTDAGRVRGDMVIPNYSPEGDLVIAVGEKTFSGSFQSIVWPERLASIEKEAFRNCSLPESFSLPDGLISIGQSAFAYCRGITKLHIPASVTEIGVSAFEGLSTLTDITFGEGTQISTIPASFALNTKLCAITLPDSVTSIGSLAFGHTDLREIRLPNGLTSIETRAFIGCTQLTSVSNTAYLTSIGYEAFAECAALTEITLTDRLTRIGYHAFRECSALSYTEYNGGYYLAIGQNPYAILAYGRKDVETADLHGDARLAVGGAFEGNTSLTTFTFPDGTTEIPDRFFYGCTALTSVNIPAALTRIGDEAFYQCRALPTLTLPEGVLTVGQQAFFGCHAFTEMVLPDSITEIGAGAFSSCQSMTSIRLPASLTAISHSLFKDCTSLRGKLVIPEGVTSIGSLPFYRCNELQTLVIPVSVTRFEEQVFFNDVYSVEYAGTMAEWEAIEKDSNWRAGKATLQTVTCVDGSIDYD